MSDQSRAAVRIRAAERVIQAAERHIEDCCRTDIGWRDQMKTHDALTEALGAYAKEQSDSLPDARSLYPERDECLPQPGLRERPGTGPCAIQPAAPHSTAQIEMWADEAELGYDPEELARHPRPLAGQGNP
jgi:hypothetical protein